MSIAAAATIASMTPIASVALTIGRTLIVDTIKVSSYGIRKLLTENPNILLHLDQLDIDAEMHVIDAIISSLPDEDILSQPDNKPLQVALNNLHKGIQQIHLLLETLDLEIKEHHNLWFNSWRTPGYISTIGTIEKVWELVRKRNNTLIRTAQYIANNTIIKQNRFS
jgi:hypothetical protein